MQLILNELSISSSSQNTDLILHIIEIFIKTYSFAVSGKVGFSRSIITPIDINSIQLTPEYCFAQWRNNSVIDKDLRIRFKGICDRQVIATSIQNEIEVSCSSIPGKGLSLAYENNSTLISFLFDKYWNNYEINCSLYCLSDDMVTDIQLHNLSSCESVEKNSQSIDVIRKTELASYKTSNQLLEQKDNLFPSLIFHKTVITQLEYQIQVQHISAILQKLLLLEKYFSNWDGKEFDMSAFPTRCVSPESKETLQQFKAEHTYEYNGEEIVVSYHMRYTGNIPGRIYFYPDRKTKKAVICSLSTKLPTVSEPKMKP